MEILLSILIAPITFFAFKPIACGLVASALSVPVFLRNFSVGDRLFIGFVALVWWFFTWTEARTSVQTNIRVDLLFLGPIYLGLGVIAVWRVFNGGDEPTRVRARQSAQAEMDSARETALSTPPSQVESARPGTVDRNPSPEAPRRADEATSWVSLKRVPKWVRNPWLVSLAVIGALPFFVSGSLQMGGASAIATFDEAKRMRFEAAFRDDATVARFFGDIRATEDSWAGYYVGGDQDDRFKHLIINRDGKTWLYNAKHGYRVGNADDALVSIDTFVTTVADDTAYSALGQPLTLRRIKQDRFMLTAANSNMYGTERQLPFTKMPAATFPAVSNVGNTVEFVGVFSARYKPDADKSFWGAQLWLWRSGNKHWGHYLRQNFVAGTRNDFLHAGAVDVYCVGNCEKGDVDFSANGGTVTLRPDPSGGFIAQGYGFDSPVLLTRGELIPGFILDLAPLTTVKENKHWLKTVNTGRSVAWAVPKS
jgi:hypothetical protein